MSDEHDHSDDSSNESGHTSMELHSPVTDELASLPSRDGETDESGIDTTFGHGERSAEPHRLLRWGRCQRRGHTPR